MIELFNPIDLILLIIHIKYIELGKLLRILQVLPLVYLLDSYNDTELEIKDLEYLGMLCAVNKLAFVLIRVGEFLAMVSLKVIELVDLFLEGLFIDGG